MNNYYIEYMNGNEFQNIFCNKAVINALLKHSHIKVLRIKKGNPKTDKWEDIMV